MQFSFLKAQWVTIPDTNFVNWLNANGYVACMNGNSLDTTCTDVINAWQLDLQNQNIINLDGVQYFDNLYELDFSGSQVTSLPTLPPNLISLDCAFNQITNIPFWNATLTNIVCSGNPLISLPSLPSSLEYLYCYYNQLTSLPVLPSTLKVLNCGGNSITNLPPLPNSLVSLYCESSPLLMLPTSLPDSLRVFHCAHSQFSSLPILPDSLQDLNCKFNQLTNLPPLPASLILLDCRNNLLINLPTLPVSLWQLTCSFNQLTSIPILPASLAYLDCNNNFISSLPALSNSLNTLWCYNNQLTSLPSLPNSLVNLKCDYNQLSTLPFLPNSLRWLECGFNQLTTLPELPDSLNTCYLNNNPSLPCLPKLNQISTLFFLNTAVNCLPNYGNVTQSNPPLSSLPLCDLFNTNNCTAYWNISGKVYTDTNNNCITDNNELRLPNMKLMLDSSGTLIQQTYTGAEGLYSFDTKTGTYTYTVDTTDLPVMVTCPAAGFQTSVLTAVDSMDYDMDFGMQCKPGFDVGVTSVARDSGIFRPANYARVKISAGDISNFYGLHCAAGTSGTVQVVFNGAVSYIGVTAGALTPVVSGDTLLYSIADFGTVNFNSDLSFTMQTDTTAPLGSQVCFDVSVTPTAGDINTANNSLQHCFTVVNSIDPNTKEVFPESNIDTSQHWLTYTINFQNTGSAPAQHIYILDTLDNNLDESSFTLLAYNHQPITQVNGKVIRFNFPNINLPDSTNDEPHSHGYVQYKVKLKTGLTNGTLIHNTAHIVFDFNTPVITNTVTNQVHITTGTDNFQFSTFNFQFLPNPFHHSTLLKISSSIKSGNYNLEIYDVLGNKVREINTHGKNEIIIERKNLEAGIYIFKLFDGKELMGTGKLVVQ
jgi:uncharacterized repeat protein (TIGR01451 family)